ncbi:helix-turn-helix domain-containing protein [Paenibacillus radicis (ex Xue et al. 2023)]|uniref:AraC family transcriptional regulator n=1 Tax=Paenibacillus radicis (ex Xue et al. 2023) TaxID=2972489 RepID=A0ABT1YLR9_9BACL|nr:AraC family transcriptional regulator [Paenibacillus radicis (ex Xue et al. 2023)]MCR8634126.1 AraC family transcriptional regulator [Paenibacillus radicis (ex Xue et al. 2023)]
MGWRQLALLLPGNKLFNKILLYFLSLLIPIVIIGLIVYLNVDHLVKKDVSQKLTDNLIFSSRTVDGYLGMAQTANNNLIMSDTFQRYLQPYRQLPDSDKVNVPLIIRAIAENLNLLSSFVDHIFMYTDTDKIYTSQELADFNTFFDEFYQMERYSKSYWKQKLLKSSFFELLPPSIVGDYNGIHLKQSIPSVTTQYVNGRLVTMVTSISVPAITAAFKNNSIFPTTSYFIVDKKQNLILNNSGLSPEIIRSIAEQFPEEGRTEYMKVDDSESLVVRISSENFGWNYFSITPVSSFSNESSSILSLVFWICITLIVVGVLFSFVFSMNLYNPIKNIRDILIQSEKQINFGNEFRSNDELKMIGNRVHQLVQQHQDASLKINKYSSELLDQFFMNLLRGNHWVQQETLSQILEDISFKAERYLCCNFMFRYKERFYHEIQETDRLLIQEKMKKVVWGIMQQHVDCYLLEYEPNFYVCLVCMKREEDRSLLNLALETMKQTFEYDTVYCELTIGLGKMYPKVEDIAMSYSDAMTAMDQKLNGSDNPIADAADLTIEQTYYYSFLDENKLVNGLRAGNMEGLKADVDELIRLNKNRGVSYSYLGALVVELWNTGIRYIHEKQLSLNQLLAEEEYKVLLNKNMAPNEFYDRVQRLLDFYQRIIHETAAKGETRAETVISLITGYIEKNYHKDIYLESISTEIGLSAKHVSRTFKEGTGTSITDYIGFIRMTKAKELLIHSNYKINEIAERVGIGSRTTFLRVFKKSEGISPVDYRNAHIHERDVSDAEL